MPWLPLVEDPLVPRRLLLAFPFLDDELRVLWPWPPDWPELADDPLPPMLPEPLVDWPEPEPDEPLVCAKVAAGISAAIAAAINRLRIWIVLLAVRNEQSSC